MTTVAAGVGRNGEFETGSRDYMIELETSNARLKATNVELQAYAYCIAHELRAPLRRMAGFSKMLQKERALELPAETLVRRICQNAVDMDKLVTGLLDFSSLDFVPLIKRTVKPGKIFQEVFLQLHSEDSGRSVELKLGTLPTCQGDQMLLRRVFFNLIGNAFKYSRDCKAAVIEVGWRKEKDEGVYFVRDNGVGFNMEYAHNLFQVFHRLHRRGQFEGTGVGLAIVHRVIKRHGGRVWAEGVVDGGATFYFSIPEQKEGADGH
jgi:light-regulated signal transduction histidine kinase (bacteriophytochrome)